jgi:hypothetical protein
MFLRAVCYVYHARVTKFCYNQCVMLHVARKCLNVSSIDIPVDYHYTMYIFVISDIIPIGTSVRGQGSLRSRELYYSAGVF